LLVAHPLIGRGVRIDGAAVPGHAGNAATHCDQRRRDNDPEDIERVAADSDAGIADVHTPAPPHEV